MCRPLIMGLKIGLVIMDINLYMYINVMDMILCEP